MHPTPQCIRLKCVCVCEGDTVFGRGCYAMQTSNDILTLISAISSFFCMLCFSVTRMPFSSRMLLQRGSTLSLMRTFLMEMGGILEGFVCCIRRKSPGRARVADEDLRCKRTSATSDDGHGKLLVLVAFEWLCGCGGRPPLQKKTRPLSCASHPTGA